MFKVGKVCYFLFYILLRNLACLFVPVSVMDVAISSFNPAHDNIGHVHRKVGYGSVTVRRKRDRLSGEAFHQDRQINVSRLL